MIYFVQQGEAGAIKIGYSGNVEQRMRELQTSSPHRLILLGTVPGTYKKERQIHQYLNYYRTQGEWFHPSDFVKEYIISIPGYKPFELDFIKRNKPTPCTNTVGTSEGKAFHHNSIINLHKDADPEKVWHSADNATKDFWDSFATMFQGAV